jgi:hypothetical protein
VQELVALLGIASLIVHAREDSMARSRARDGRRRQSRSTSETATATDEPNPTSKQFPLLISPDGVWQYNGDDEKEVIESLPGLSDRAVAIIAGTVVDVRIKTAILSVCTGNHKIEDRMFQPSGPLGPFSVKIDMARMLGIITQEAYADLVIFKDIRNAFAHRLDIRDFRTQWIKDRCANFKLVETHIGNFRWETPNEKVISWEYDARPRLFVADYHKKKADARERYLMIAQLITTCLAFIGFLPHRQCPA